MAKEVTEYSNIFIKLADVITGLKSTIDDKESAEYALLNELVEDLVEKFEHEPTFDKVIFLNDCEDGL
jgi:hypothetical protein